MSTRWICSVYFDELKDTRPFSTTRNGLGYNHTYTVPAAAQGSYELLEVTDAEDLVYVGNQKTVSAPVYADPVPGGIADDLARQWQATGLSHDRGGPGVSTIAGSTPTEEELAVLLRRQRNWCQAVIDQAGSDWMAGKKHLVGDVQRKCARWMGQLGHEWIRPDDAGMVRLIPCPLCATKISSESIVCANCGNVVDVQKMQ